MSLTVNIIYILHILLFVPYCIFRNTGVLRINTHSLKKKSLINNSVVNTLHVLLFILLYTI